MPNPAQITLALLKPDVVANPIFRTRALARIRADPRWQVVREQAHVAWTPQQAECFYGDHRGKFFYQRLCEYMLSGPFTALVLEGPQVIRDWRGLIGPTSPVKARINQPETLRALYGLTDTRNSFHGSDSPDSARLEIHHLFSDFDFSQYESYVKR
ncbi:hypothetical protein IWQ60_006887 [Tieghemiomyces parasiticus]|uniref:Nucleoside diphosphate kinase n=1 Tax=Tieghemiomyces parasiticus TaxID=78921 RepID=A0A9W8A1K3_9FUNG|nr:hypothetical protein IWQ60_006887 [Tieghemiomyces parasiticus]